MYGEHTDQEAAKRIQTALDSARTEQAEIGLTKKNSKSHVFIFPRVAFCFGYKFEESANDAQYPTCYLNLRI